MRLKMVKAWESFIRPQLHIYESIGCCSTINTFTAEDKVNKVPNLPNICLHVKPLSLGILQDASLLYIRIKFRCILNSQNLYCSSQCSLYCV